MEDIIDSKKKKKIVVFMVKEQIRIYPDIVRKSLVSLITWSGMMTEKCAIQKRER